MDFNDQNKLIPFSNNSLIRARNSLLIVNKIMKEISLYKFDKWEWWKNLSDEWKLSFLFFVLGLRQWEDEFKKFPDIDESDLDKIIQADELELLPYYEESYGPYQVFVDSSLLNCPKGLYLLFHYFLISVLIN